MPETRTPQQIYRLADHVRACHVDGQVVLLDLRRDRYIGVGGALLPALASRVADWPLCKSKNGHQTRSTEVDAWVANMLQQGMLTSGLPTAAVRPSITEPQHSLASFDEPTRQGMKWRRVARLAYSSITVGHWLKRFNLADIAIRVERFRSTAASESAGASDGKLRAAASWYLHTRPLVMSSHDECLRDSLTMLRFLCAEGLYPRWVIGVRTRPFGAHSWVQAGSLVLNDVHENVRSYTPILVV
jgi:hypothetical protein